MKRTRGCLSACMGLILLIAGSQHARGDNPTKVGVATVLSGDLAILGENIERSIETYKRHFLRHPVEFVLEDAKKGSLDGLRAYEKLIRIDHVQMIIGGTSSNGTLAAKALINDSKTPLLTPLTGGSNIDGAGPYIFRIGNSDILNGKDQADYFADRGITEVALLTEETEYTQDIAQFFKARFLERGGKLVFDESFLPEKTDFRTEAVRIAAKRPKALFMPTQSGLALGLFLKQSADLKRGRDFEIHTTFVAAVNPEAASAAGNAMTGVRYMAPKYDRDNVRFREFLAYYRADHGVEPAIAFHSAGTVDALDMLQRYLDETTRFDAETFQRYLLSSVKGYRGLMGAYSFDADGNADTGFEEAVIP